MLMRRSCLLLFAALLLVAHFSAAEAQADEVRLLFAGSSSTYWNDMPREIAKLVSEKLIDKPGVKVTPEIVGRSGSDIRVYSEPGFDRYEYGVRRGQTFVEKLREEKPDLVVLQVVCGFITEEGSELKDNLHAQAITSYCKEIRAAGGEPVFYEMGWGRKEREAEGRRRILELARENKIKFYAPCSTAWAQVYAERPKLELQHPQDAAHPGDAGHFLNLACFYAALTGQSPEGKLPRTFAVWPHGLPKPETEEAKAAEKTRIEAFKPDAYQAKMPKWMYRNMSLKLTATLSEETAAYLEAVAWKTHQQTRAQLQP